MPPNFRRLFFALVIAFCLPAHADDVTTVTIGSTQIKLSVPEGMSAVAKDDVMTQGANDLIPANCTLLARYLTTEVPDTSDSSYKAPPHFLCEVFALKDETRDIDSGEFIDFVATVANTAVRKVLVSQFLGFDYIETQKRLDKFQQDTGVKVELQGDVYSLGMVSRSVACVSYMQAQHVTLKHEMEAREFMSVSVIGYIRLRQKVVLVVTTMNKRKFADDDLLTLKHAAEHYQVALQNLNN